MDKKFSIRQFPSPEHPYIAFPQKNLAVLNICRFTTGEIGPQSRLYVWNLYNSVLTCLQNIINSYASAPLNATKIAVKKVSDVDVCMFGPDL